MVHQGASQATSLSVAATLPLPSGRGEHAAHLQASPCWRTTRRFGRGSPSATSAIRLKGLFA